MPYGWRGATMFVPKIDDGAPMRQTAESFQATGPCAGTGKCATGGIQSVEMYLAKRVGGWGLTKIGKFYNGRHHTTVRHAIRRIEALREVNPDVGALLAVLIDPERNGTRL